MGFVEFREDIIEEDDGFFVGSLGDKVGFDKFKSENDGAGFTTRGGGVGDLVVEVKNIVVTVDTERGVA